MEFRQGPCIKGTQKELEIVDVKVGWEAPSATVKISKKKRKSKTKRRSNSSHKDKMAQKCFRTEQKLESVNRNLRRGYKAGKGADLRHKRRQYEAYLSRFCQ